MYVCKYIYISISIDLNKKNEEQMDFSSREKSLFVILSVVENICFFFGRQ